MFACFASELDEATQHTLFRGLDGKLIPLVFFFSKKTIYYKFNMGKKKTIFLKKSFIKKN